MSSRTRRRVVASLAIASIAIASAAYATGVIPDARTTAPPVIRPKAAPVAVGALRIAVSPDTLRLAPGTSSSAEVCVRGARGPRLIRLRARVDVATAAFDPARIPNRGCSTLTLTPVADAPSGTYEVRIGARQRGWHRIRRGSTVRSLTVEDVPSPSPTDAPPRTGFAIAGDAGYPLLPGGPPAPIDLRFTNPTASTLHVTDAHIVVVGTSAGPACAPSNFVTTPFTFGSAGSGGVTVPPGATVSLSGAGVDPSVWPTIALKDEGDQDACENATVELSYRDGLAYS